MRTKEQQIQDMQAQMRSLRFANPTASFYQPITHTVSPVSRSVTIGGDYPALTDFGNITSIEYQSPFKVQVGTSIVPTGNPNDGASLFGIINTIVGSTYECSLTAQGAGGFGPPLMGFVSVGVNAYSIATLQSLSNTQYPWMFGPGSFSTMSGVGCVQINGDTQKLFSAKRTPASSADPGTLGEICFDDNFIYIYTAAGWKRAGIAAF